MRIVFCGVGALGSTTALLCRNFDAELVFVDFDRVESKNLLAQAYVKASLGKNKAQALKLQLDRGELRANGVVVPIVAGGLGALILFVGMGVAGAIRLTDTVDKSHSGFKELVLEK